MKRTLTAAFVIACLDLYLATVARPGEPIEFDEVMSSMRTARERLKSGVFHVVGTASFETATVGDDPEHTLRNESKRESDIRVLCAFDFDRGLIRSDRTVPTWERLVFQQRVSPGAPPGENRRMTFLRTPEASYHYSGAEGTTEILDPDTALSSSGRDSGWMDVRALGTYANDEFQGHDFISIFDSYLSKKTFKEMDAENGVYHIRLVTKFDELAEFWIDSNKGFTIVKSTRRQRIKPQGPLQWGEPDLVRTIDWKEVSGAWVPVDYRSSTQSYQKRSTSFLSEKTQYNWQFSWESINKPIDDSYFDPQSVQTFGSTVSDRRKQKPVAK